MHFPSTSQRQRDADKLWSRLTFGESEKQRQIFDGHSAAAFRLRDEGLERQVSDEREVTWHLGRRIADMSLWIKELEGKSDTITSQLDTLSIFNTRLNNAISTLPPVLQVNDRILHLRKMRRGVDLIEDEPQRKLHDEINLIKEKYGELSSILKVSEECARNLRKFRFALGKQLEDRKKAKAIDSSALQMTPHSTNVVLRNNSQQLQSLQAQKEESDWDKASWEQRTKAEVMLLQCENLQAKIRSALRLYTGTIQSAVCETNFAFEEHLKNLRRVKEKLETEHYQISISIRENEDLLDKLKKARSEKISSLALTQSRIALRASRPNFELVWDEVDKGLQKEERILKSAILGLECELENAARVLKALLASQLTVQEEINVKVNSLAIDEAQVLPLRKTISIHVQ